MSDFAGLNTALTSLYAQQRGLDVSGQNVTNANTEGYSRQRVDLAAIGAPATPALWSTWSGAGAGVQVTGTVRIRDLFLDERGMVEHGQLALSQGRTDTLAHIERAFGEPGEQGLQSQLADFWNSWDDLANNPDDSAARQQVLERSRTLAAGFNRLSSSFSQLWDSAAEKLDATVADINATAATVAHLNDAIRSAVAAGAPANDLMDQRDVLVQKLADTVGVTVRQSDQGMVDLFLGGGALVRGERSNDLAVSTTAVALGQVPDPALGGPPAVTITWAKDGYPAGVTSGQMGSMVESMTQTLPSYQARLDAVAAQLASTVNAVHATGVDATGAAGGPVFAGTTAASLSVALTSTSQIAADAAASSRDGSVAAAMAELASGTTGGDTAYRQLVVSLGVESQTAQRRVDIQSGVTKHIDEARDGIAGVNLDEEMTQMLAYQRAYEGASRYLTTVDSMLDQLINHTGHVGLS